MGYIDTVFISRITDIAEGCIIVIASNSISEHNVLSFSQIL